MPYVTYSRMARHFIDDVYTFADEHQEYGLYSYNDILFENGIEWSIVSMSEVDTSTLDGKCITALLLCRALRHRLSLMGQDNTGDYPRLFFHQNLG